jgi:thioredoxin reductase (NADPH)
MRDIVIIGSGPAGYTAAIYAARANLAPLVVASSVEFGGDLMTTTDVDNFPGFPEGIMGPQLMTDMQKQAERFGAEVLYDDVTSVTLAGPIKKISLGNGDTVEAKAVIVASGSAYRKLGIPDEDRLSGHGVSWCATCDGAFFREKIVAVVGGGDSAMEEATFLTRFADKVYIIHRSEKLRASAVMQERAENDPKIEFIFNATVERIYGGDSVTGVGLVDTVTGVERTLDVSGLFIAIGSDPRTHIVHGQLDLTEQGTIAVASPSSRTNLEGVFAAGDVTDPTYRQAVTAAGTGCIAALDALHYLESLPQEHATAHRNA